MEKTKTSLISRWASASISVALIGLATSASAGLFHSKNTETAKVFDQLTVGFGATAPALALPSSGFRVYVWNIHKAKDAHLARDFKASSGGADLVLFQEAVNMKKFTADLSAADPALSWTMAKSFSVSEETYTGVATGSRVLPLKQEVIVSVPTEPISRTHKTILISQYQVEGQNDPLLVANIHAINFVKTKTFEIQIRQLVARIREHRGPMLVGGDFNTWNNNRLSYLKKVFAPLGLTFLETESDSFFNLDHIFVRGLKPRLIDKLSYIHSSDHSPMVVELNFDPQPLESHENIP